MKAARFDYLRPHSLAQALDALAPVEHASRLIAGSQSLGPMLNLRLVRPERLIDISALPELRTIATQDGWLRIGAGITHAEIEDGRFEPFQDHPWRRVAGTIAYRSVRNRGTVGGSLAHADPAADWMLAAWAADAQIELARASGTRQVPVRDFMQAAYTTALEADEMVVAVHVPVSLSRASWGYYKVCRKVGDFAETSCAVVIDDARGVCRIAVGALDGPPILLEGLAQQLFQHRDPAEAWTDRIDQDLMAAVPGRDRIARRMMSATINRAIARALGHERAHA
jgi:carbon-monoxide dehydrogenase medium subunit